MPKKTKKLSLAAAVDRLGLVKAQQAELAAEATALCDLLKAADKGEIEGDLFRAVIVNTTQRRLDTAIAKGFLSVGEIALATKEIEVVSVRVNARTGAFLKAVA